MKLYDLRTEYRENPIGLTDKAPRFSWKIESEEQNTIQTVYEINVTDEKGNVVWNSGKKAYTPTWQWRKGRASRATEERSPACLSENGKRKRRASI